jgi:DNA-directed RNA polymerase subunit RPC12/RpoP
VSKSPGSDSYDVVCPHCKKQFRGELIGEEGNPRRGFKCPHCRLFVPYERAETEDARGGERG